MKKKHGGKRAGAGRPTKADSRNVPRSIKVSQAVSSYLDLTGTGIIEHMIRNSKGFKVFRTTESDATGTSKERERQGRAE